MPRILIVGAGIAGLAVGRRLQMAGFEYQIVERNTAPSVLGCGLALPFNAMRAAQHLGLDNKLNAASYQVDEIVYTLPDASVLCQGSLHDPPFENDRFVALTRAQLHEVLLDGLQKKILFGTELVSLEQRGSMVKVTMSAGIEDFDLVIAADGINSNCRKAVFGPGDMPIDHGYQTWRWLVDLPGHSLQPTYSLGRTDMFMHYPVGPATIYCYGHVKDSSLPDGADDYAASIRATFSGYGGKVPEMLARMPEDKIIPGRVQTLSKSRYFKDRVVFVGDAGSGCPPTLQQGAAKAFEDSLCLVRSLQEHPIDEALGQYAAERRPSVDWVMEQSNFAFVSGMDMENPEVVDFRNDMLRSNGPMNLQGWRELATNPEIRFSANS